MPIYISEAPHASLSLVNMGFHPTLPRLVLQLMFLVVYELGLMRNSWWWVGALGVVRIIGSDNSDPKSGEEESQYQIYALNWPTLEYIWVSFKLHLKVWWGEVSSHIARGWTAYWSMGVELSAPQPFCVFFCLRFLLKTLISQYQLQ